ncbi:hypothetical protein [Lentzea terrae]|uniref:hypothetical protein n=1 Tax=Lentzea terrae TaxID=2200761 RepID=UPI001300927C|nr:hypothetical protein [Lentzea terrae]
MGGPHQVTVSLGAVSHTLSPGEEATFGRAPDCVLRIDAQDTAISRYAGVVLAENGTWFVVNLSGARQLDVVDDIGFRSVLAPGRRCALQGKMRVLLRGHNTKPYELRIDAPRMDAPVIANVPEGLSTVVGDEVTLNQAERRTLVALLAGYLLDGDKYDPYPRSYDAAGHRLNLPGSTVRKKIEYLRKRLKDAGVPNMDGPSALMNLAEYVLSRGLITKDDLGLL